MDDEFDKPFCLKGTDSIIIPEAEWSPMTIKVNYKWICEQIRQKSTYDSLDEAIRVLMDLDEEQNQYALI